MGYPRTTTFALGAPSVGAPPGKKAWFHLAILCTLLGAIFVGHLFQRGWSPTFQWESSEAPGDTSEDSSGEETAWESDFCPEGEDCEGREVSPEEFEEFTNSEENMKRSGWRQYH